MRSSPLSVKLVILLAVTATSIQLIPSVDRSSLKPVSLLDISDHVTVTSVCESAVADRLPGALGGVVPGIDRNAATMALVLFMDRALFSVAVPVTCPVVRETLGLEK